MIAAVGGDSAGVEHLINQYNSDLKNTMNITGAETLGKIEKSILKK